MFGIIDFEYDIAMPNEILQDMKDWLEEGLIKSVQHQEFIYSYYWLLAYLWRYTLYSEHKITQSEIKRMLGYNPNDSRLDYILKKEGILDSKGYTSATKNYPVSWNQKKKEDIQFTMLLDLDEEYRKYMNKFTARNNFVKEPLKHTFGDEYNEGAFWSIANTHEMSGHLFRLCMSDRDLGCAGFYLYGVLTFIRDKSSAVEFPCANETLVTFTGWNERRVIRITNSLQSVGLLHKEQIRKIKGSVNHYRLTCF